MTQAEAASRLEVSTRTFRRYITRYRRDGLKPPKSGRVTGVPNAGAPASEILALKALYARAYSGWTARHFYEVYRREHGGKRSYTWVKTRLQKAGLVKKGKPRRSRVDHPSPAFRHGNLQTRESAAGSMLHQIATKHEWIPGRMWHLVLTLDDATNRVYSGFFAEETGVRSSFRGIRETVLAKGLFDSLCVHRSIADRMAPSVPDGVAKKGPEQIGRAMKELGIDTACSPSPAARSRCNRVLRTLRERLPLEMAHAGIAGMREANEFLSAYWRTFNGSFAVETEAPGEAFVQLTSEYKFELEDILRLKEQED